MRAALVGFLVLWQWCLLARTLEAGNHTEVDGLHDAEGEREHDSHAEDERLLAEEHDEEHDHEHEDEHQHAHEDEHEDEHEHDHDHAHSPWEWSAIFELSAGEVYTWSAARGSGGAYADESMKLAIIALVGEDHLHDVEPAAEALFGGSEDAWTSKNAGEILALDDGGADARFRLRFDGRSWLSLFQLEVASSGRFAFFADHAPLEFESSFHFFKDDHGRDVEPVEEPHGAENDDTDIEAESGGNLGLAIGAACIFSLPALLMIICIGPAVQRFDVRAFPAMNAFASGAVSSAAAFLLMPEGLYMASSGLAETEGTALWGSALLAGWLFGVLIHHIADATSRRHGAAVSQPDVDISARQPDGEQESAAKGEPKDGGDVVASGASKSSEPHSIMASVLFGDFFHNLVDGMVIGFSARACSRSALWSVTIATALHEAPQEMADFIVLLTKAKLNWRMAVLANCLTAFPAGLLGAILAHEADMSANMQGAFMAFGAGVYLFVAITELGPTVLHVEKPFLLNSVLRFLAFLLGAVLIGLILLGHEHCGHEESDGSGSASGQDLHAHAH